MWRFQQFPARSPRLSQGVKADGPMSRGAFRRLCPWLCLCLVGAFHDDDCEAAALAADSIVPWRTFRLQVTEGCSAAEGILQELARGEHWRGSEQCQLGVAAACLCRAGPLEARVCLQGISVQRMLGSRWPLLKLLGDLQRGEEASCDGLAHPSLDWAEWRQQATAFARDTPLWLQGDLDVPESLDAALGAAQGVVWKSASGAIAQGRTIAEWTSLCSLGILTANAVRAASLVLGQSDVYRIVQRALESAENIMRSLEAVLQSPWPIFQVLHAMSLMKRSFHDMRFAAADLEASTPLERRSATWHAAASALRTAAAAAEAERGASVVIMTGLPHQRLFHLLDLFKHADRTGYLAPLVIVPLYENVTESCEAIAELFAQRRRMPPSWSPCLPFVSQFLQRAQYLYLHVALQLDLPVLWFDFHLVLLQDPFLWLPDALKGRLSPPSYREPCQHFCAEFKEADLYLGDEFYAQFLVKSTLMLLRPTLTTKQWLRTLLEWLFSFAFAHEDRGLQYLVFPDRLDVVPSVSMLPALEDVPRVRLGELDTEQHFVGTDGWFGEARGVRSFEISGWLSEPDRIYLLESLRTGRPEQIQKILQETRRLISPRRPTERAYQLHAREQAPEHCVWRRARGFLGGFAAEVEVAFGSEEAAQCKCLHLGAACRGVTCESEQTCTVRQGAPFLAPSPNFEWSLVKECLGCNATAIKRIVHVNYADGCCEQEQALSSETALQFGAQESRPLRGDFLDDAFRKKNEVLLNFNRTPELTKHKTPSGKIGYYVWKPYVLLQTLLDPKLPWDTTAVAWTDAGIHFVGDMRPLVNDYLRDSDVSSTRTPMNEGDFSKRDAFVLLDADFPIMMDTNQIATGFILVRKTALAVAFLEKWLAACEDRRVMTEEDSVLGYPEHPGYKNNNDDQTAFSLLFKRHGFRAFSVEERDAVVYTGRNLAKFVKASNDFALGVDTDREAYLQAAEDAACLPGGRTTSLGEMAAGLGAYLRRRCACATYQRRVVKTIPGGGVQVCSRVFGAADDLLRGAEGGQPSFPQHAPPGKFIFRPRTGRMNWRLLHSLDIDRVVREGDVDTIQAYMDNITFSRFGREDLDVTSDDCIIKVVQLAQLCMEFLNYMCASSQHLVQGLTEKVRIQAAQLKVADTRRRSERPRRSPRGERQAQAFVRKCPHCTKRFQSEQYLNEHLLRRHIADVFQVEKVPEPQPESILGGRGQGRIKPSIALWLPSVPKPSQAGKLSVVAWMPLPTALVEVKRHRPNEAAVGLASSANQHLLCMSLHKSSARSLRQIAATASTLTGAVRAEGSGEGDEGADSSEESSLCVDSWLDCCRWAFASSCGHRHHITSICQAACQQDSEPFLAAAGTCQAQANSRAEMAALQAALRPASSSIRRFATATGLPRLRLRGLPFHATARDVAGFFRGFRLAPGSHGGDAVELLRGHGRRPTGQAFAYFQDVVEAMKAKDDALDGHPCCVIGSQVYRLELLEDFAGRAIEREEDVPGDIVEEELRDKVRKSMVGLKYKDTWLPDWTEDASLACKSWATDKSWGALQRGRSLQEACDTFWAQLNCAKTCGCSKSGTSASSARASTWCSDTWTPSWAEDARHACSVWAQDVVGSLVSACKGNWAQEHCAKTCGCLGAKSETNPTTTRHPSRGSERSAWERFLSGDEEAQKLAAEITSQR
ncbi:unnamed protein product [Effrenium voratum]|nr:unnamed protein product [Effrenium voratum]